MELSFKHIMESNQYGQQREIIRKEVNRAQVPYEFNNSWYAPICTPALFGRTTNIDRDCFKHIPGEYEQIKDFKKEVGKSKNYKFATILHATF